MSGIAFQDYLAQFEPGIQKLAKQARQLVLDTVPGVIELVDPPSGIIASGFSSRYADLVCAIAPYKAYINLIFGKGTQLPDPHRLLVGTGKRARHVRINKDEDFQKPGVRDLLLSAAHLARSLPATLALQLGPQVSMEFVLIPPGKFVMGSQEDAPAHPVEMASPFYLGKYAVTQAQWIAVMGSNPSHFKYSDSLPVETVSWGDCVLFCQKLSALTGRQARLPAEAEWEYACRAGSRSAYFFGDALEELDGYAWYRNNAGGVSHSVGLKIPNAWGLYDMHGGIDEYCLDLWHPNYTGAPADGRAWIEHGEPDLRVLRGGSWYDLAEHCRAPHRNYYNSTEPSEDHGFRVAVTPSGSQSV
jgi:formylglycine-generating enzyme required for sulfatase activity